ncbi:MAG: hypothetical protein Q4G01_02970, partial [Eubacteriales bacterium]|nr:hypothetical protein [Eubacteriales bacterium]
MQDDKTPSAGAMHWAFCGETLEKVDKGGEKRGRKVVQKDVSGEINKKWFTIRQLSARINLAILSIVCCKSVGV